MVGTLPPTRSRASADSNPSVARAASEGGSLCPPYDQPPLARETLLRDQIAGHLAERRDPAQRHGPHQLGAQVLKNVTHAVPPPTARPHTAGRPISTARAPSASALTMSVPRRMPPST